MKQKAYRIAKILAWFTVFYNLAEGIISTFFGFHDETLSLFGFGMDSFIEMISAIGILWMIVKEDNSHESHREKSALKITGYCLYALAILLFITAIFSFYEKHQPKETLAGIIISLVSIGVMYVLIQQKTKIGLELGSNAMVADANCAKVCMYMSMVLLVSSAIYHFTQWSFIDGIGAMGIAYFSFSEGRESIDKANGVVCQHHH